jgi:hypothetical protein
MGQGTKSLRDSGGTGWPRSIAARLSPHPSIRSAQQCRPSPQHRTCPRVARATTHPDRCHQSCQRQGFDKRSARGTESTRASLPLLRQPHDHHRDLLAGVPAKAPPHAGSTSNQDRYLMIPSPSIRHRIDTLHSGSRSAGSAPACSVAPHRPADPPQIRSRNPQAARPKSKPQTSFDLKRSPAPLPSHLPGRRHPPKSP